MKINRSNKRSGPSWMVLYLLVILPMVLYRLEMRLRIPAVEHKILEFCIVLVIFVLVWLWVSVNSGQIIREERNHWLTLLRRPAETLGFWERLKTRLVANASRVISIMKR